MKKSVIMFLLGASYVCVVSVIIFIYFQSTIGTISGVIATFVVSLLIIPLITFMCFFAFLREADVKPKDSLEKEAAELNFDLFTQCISEWGLSEREIEVSWLLYRGYTNRQIAEELFVAETTVKKHTSHIYGKVQVSGRKEFREKVRSEYEKG